MKFREFHPEGYAKNDRKNNNITGPIRDLLNPIGNVDWRRMFVALQVVILKAGQMEGI